MLSKLGIGPVYFTGNRGSIMIGNSDLANISTFQYEKFAARVSDTKIDSINAIFSTRTKFDKVVLSLGVNVDFKEQNLNFAARMRLKTASKSMWEHCQDLFYGSQSMNDIPLSHPYEWSGLDRYRDIDSATTKAKNYAQISKIIQTDKLEVTFFVHSSCGCITSHGINFDLMDSIINYGPWANKQRVLVQSFFYPPKFKDYVVTPRSESPSPDFKLSFFFNGESILKIPIREESEDYHFADIADGIGISRNLYREFGWAKLKFEASSTLEISIPQEPTQLGFETDISVYLSNVAASTSVNFEPLFISKDLSINTKIYTPLKWYGVRKIATITKCEFLELWLLRNHVTFISDLISDFSEDAQTASYQFAYEYKLGFTLNNAKIMLNLNPDNVIDKHNNLDDNHFLKIVTPKSYADIVFLSGERTPTFREVMIDFKVNIV